MLLTVVFPDRFSGQSNSIGRVCTGVRLFPLYFLKQLTSDLGILLAYGPRVTTACGDRKSRYEKVKVKNYGQAYRGL